MMSGEVGYHGRKGGGGGGVYFENKIKQKFKIMSGGGGRGRVGETFCVVFIFLINCWSSVVASVVLPQLCKSPLSNFFFFPVSLFALSHRSLVFPWHIICFVFFKTEKKNVKIFQCAA